MPRSVGPEMCKSAIETVGVTSSQFALAQFFYARGRSYCRLRPWASPVGFALGLRPRRPPAASVVGPVRRRRVARCRVRLRFEEDWSTPRRGAEKIGRVGGCDWDIIYKVILY